MPEDAQCDDLRASGDGQDNCRLVDYDVCVADRWTASQSVLDECEPTLMTLEDALDCSIVTDILP